MNTCTLRAAFRKRLSIALAAALPIAFGMLALAPTGPARAATSPPQVTASDYMTATSAAGLDTEAYNDAFNFAQNNPFGSIRYLILDFGCVQPSATTMDFSGVTFDNAQIQEALENAVDGAHAGYTTGDVIVTYGNNNSCDQSYSTYYTEGVYQESRTGDVANYISAEKYDYIGVADGSDMEPGWDTWADTSGLVAGANTGLYDFVDYGSADECPSSGSSGNCENGWTVADVEYASYGATLDLSLPQIYSDNDADEWTVVRNNGGSGYSFLGCLGYTTALAQAEWLELDSLNPGAVGRDLVVFQYG